MSSRSRYSAPLSPLALLWAALAIGVGYGCGSTNDTAPAAGTPAGVEQPATGGGRSAPTPQPGSIKCPYPQECSPSVGMLLSPKEESTELCTGFLIAPDVAVTASHCLPSQARATGASCAGVSLLFPEIELYPAERAECASVALASKLDPSGSTVTTDYAVIRLSREVMRPVLPVSRDGLENDTVLTFFRVNTISKSLLQGELRSANCRVIQNSLMLPVFDQAESPVGTLTDCEINPSNSGSPLVTANGSVRGIVQSALKEESTLLTERAFEERARFGLASNLSCVPVGTFADLDGGMTKLPDACAKDYSEANLRKLRSKRLDEGAPSALNAVRAPLESWHASAAGNALRLQWDPISAEGGIQSHLAARREFLLVSAAPRCFEKPGTWLERYKVLWYYRSKASFTTRTPLYRVELGLDRYRQLSTRVRSDSDREVQIDFSPADLNERGSSKVRISWDSPSGSRETLFEGLLATCPQNK